MKAKTWPCRWVAGGCPCKCHAIRSAKQDRRGQPRSPKVGRWDRWTPDHDRWILDLASRGYPPVEIAARFNRAHVVQRTVLAVRRRLTLLNGSTSYGWRSATALALALGVDHRRIRAWTAQGLLPVLHRDGRAVRYADADVEQFVTAQAGRLLDPRTIRDPRLRSLAETASVVNRRRQSA